MYHAYVENEARRRVRLKMERSARQAKQVDNYLKTHKRQAEDVKATDREILFGGATFERGAGI